MTCQWPDCDRAATAVNLWRYPYMSAPWRTPVCDKHRKTLLSECANLTLNRFLTFSKGA